MKYLFIPCLLLGALLCWSSCNKHIYVPNTVNAPLLKERYEFKGSVSPTNYQAAFAVANNIAIMANGQYVFRFDTDKGLKDNALFVDNDTRGGLIEGAIGFFKPLDTRKRMVFDVYGGYGNGSFKTLHADYYDDGSSRIINDYLLRTYFNKFFVQPGFGFVHPVFEAAVTLRFSMLKYYSMYVGPKAFQNDADRKENFLQIDDKALPFFEPAFTFRVGYKYVKFQMQLSFSMLMNDDIYNGYEISSYFQPVAVGMGASVNIAHWYDDFRKKKPFK